MRLGGVLAGQIVVVPHDNRVVDGVGRGFDDVGAPGGGWYIEWGCQVAWSTTAPLPSELGVVSHDNPPTSPPRG